MADNLTVDTARSTSNVALVACELLCYTVCKFGKFSEMKLLGIINDFYTAEDITQAKEILIDYG